LFRSLSNGFVRVNDKTEQLDNGVESPTDDQTMAFYNQSEIPFYYNLAQNFAIDDRYFASVLGPTFPNRSYLLAATSFGHLTTSDTFSPPGGYKPVREPFSICSTRMESPGVTTSRTRRRARYSVPSARRLLILTFSQ
jgi:phospholipase C